MNNQIHSKAYWAISDSLVLVKRSMSHILKNYDQLLGVVFQPIMFMLLFRYVFGGAINTGGVSYVNFLVAGILVQMLSFGSLTTAVSVSMDLQRGIVDRLKSLPIASQALLIGHVTADLIRNLISTTVMIGVGLLVGFRPTADFAGWLMIIALILIFTFAMSWVSAVLGIIAKSVEAVQWLGFIIVFPLTFASGAFVPTATMPTALRYFAENQPITHVIEAMRALMNHAPVGNHYLASLLWCVGLLLVAPPLAAYLYRRKGN